MSGGAAAEISVVLATSDRGVVLEPLEHYRRQTVAERIEVILVAPPDELAKIDPAAYPELHALRLVEAPAPFGLAAARARGALAGSAPWVFVGETHSFADPRLAERLLEAVARAPAGARPHGLVPAIYNVNPSGAISWASFLVDYGAWGPGHSGAVTYAPIYNALFERAMLERLGDELVPAMSPHDDSVFPMPIDGSHRALFVPEARIGHLNIVRFGDLARTKCWLGMAIGDSRAQRWSWPRRLAYAAAAPAIAAVLLVRYGRVYRVARRQQALPPGIAPLLALGAAVRVAGETIGYLGMMPGSVEGKLERLEIHKVDFVPGWSV